MLCHFSHQGCYVCRDPPGQGLANTGMTKVMRQRTQPWHGIAERTIPTKTPEDRGHPPSLSARAESDRGSARPAAQDEHLAKPEDILTCSCGASLGKQHLGGGLIPNTSVSLKPEQGGPKH